jgi:hypothetical protein
MKGRAERLHAMAALGNQLTALEESEIQTLCARAFRENTWFVEKSVRLALAGAARYLEGSALQAWAARYPEVAENPKKVGVIMAGNIPLAGLHDFISVLVSGHQLYAKPSAQDQFLIRWIAEQLIAIAPEMQSQIHFTEQMKEIDALVATGSDQTARQLDYYFAKKPRIIRRNRNACAVFSGDESEETLSLCTEDILAYFGLGCRSIAKVYVKNEATLHNLLKALEKPGYEAALNHKYHNNYDYNKSVFLINQVPHLDNGSVILTEADGLASPISVLHYAFYQEPYALQTELNQLSDRLQCIVSDQGWFPGSIPMGQAQHPEINDYADGVDTMAFFQHLHMLS